MENINQSAATSEGGSDRVRQNTSGEVNARLDREMRERVETCAARGEAEITRRIEEMGREWDMERVLETNASALAGAGVGLAAATGSSRWLLIPGVVPPFLLLHAVQGWCPPVPLLRRLGVRTRQEIERERYAFKALRGDFEGVTTVSGEGGAAGAAQALEAAGT